MRSTSPAHLQPAPHWNGRATASGLVAVLLLICTGCSTGPGEPIDLLREFPATEFRGAGDPLPPIWVKLKTDKRPHTERGDRKYLGTSHLRDGVLVEPTHVVLLRALARDLQTSGVCERSAIRDQEQPYILSVTLEKCTATFGEGLANLLMIFPTSGIEGVCEFGLRLEDRLGRVFLEQDFKGQATGSAAPVSGLESSAAAVLTAAMRKAIDEALPVLHAAPDRWWSRYRNQVSRDRPKATSPGRESPSSTGR